MRPGILILWSAPRCRSTAFLRMMMERGDYTVLHEPFSHVIDFGEADVGGRAVHSEQELISALGELAAEHPVFFKDTTDFAYPGLLADRDFLAAATHTFIIRDPRAAIASHYRLNPELEREEIGFARLSGIFHAVRNVTGTDPVVIDGDDLVADPEGIVTHYCERAGIPYLPEAMTWSPGQVGQWRRTERWHTEASQSAGFESRDEPGREVVDEIPQLSEYLAYHQPFYDELRAYRLLPGHTPTVVS